MMYAVGFVLRCNLGGPPFYAYVNCCWRTWIVVITVTPEFNSIYPLELIHYELWYTVDGDSRLDVVIVYLLYVECRW